jgi:hypothetical protein
VADTADLTRPGAPYLVRIKMDGAKILWRYHSSHSTVT